MDFLELLQTIGICVGSLALVAIAIMIFMILALFTPGLDEPDELSEEEQALEDLTGLSPEQIRILLNTPFVPDKDKPPKKRSPRKKT